MRDLTFKPKISNGSKWIERNRVIWNRDMIKSMISPEIRGNSSVGMIVPDEGSFNAFNISKLNESEISMNKDLWPVL